MYKETRTMGRVRGSYMNLLLNPLFIIGLIIRLSLILAISSTIVLEWYAPFLQSGIDQLTVDPWNAWIEKGGHISAFPYGYAMYIIFLPLVFLVDIFNLPAVYGYGVTLIVLDFLLLLIFTRLIPDRHNFLLSVYWLSPIMITAVHLFGFNDVVPVFFLVLTLYFLEKYRFMYAGFFCCIAVSAKLSMLLALPFFIIYFWNNKSIKRFFGKFIGGFSLGLLLLIFPFLAISDFALSMILSNPESWRALELSIGFGRDVKIYIVPFIYLLMLYMAWRIKNLNFELFSSILGVMFLIIALMTPTALGWFVWAIPFLIVYQASGDKIAIVLVFLFSLIYILSILLNIDYMNSILPQFTLLSEPEYNSIFNVKLVSLVSSLALALGVILSIRIWRESITRNDFFRLSKRPFMLGIAGNLGSGKKTLSTAVEDLFGTHSVTKILGEDYSLWDSNKPIWQVMTNLNPATVGLSDLANDLISLKNNLGRGINAKHNAWLKDGKVVIASGLHSLYLPILRECYDLSIYLDMNEKLRNHLSNTYNNSNFDIKRISEDSSKFIKPQKQYADLVLSLQPIKPVENQDENVNIRLKLIVNSRHGFDEASLTRIMVGVCGLHVNTNLSSDASEIELIVEGDISKEDIELSAKMLFPQIIDFLDIYPKWHDGIIGLMQLVVLSHMNQSLSKRLI